MTWPGMRPTVDHRAGAPAPPRHLTCTCRSSSRHPARDGAGGSTCADRDRDRVLPAQPQRRDHQRVPRPGAAARRRPRGRRHRPRPGTAQPRRVRRPPGGQRPRAVVPGRAAQPADRGRAARLPPGRRAPGVAVRPRRAWAGRRARSWACPPSRSTRPTCRATSGSTAAASPGGRRTGGLAVGPPDPRAGRPHPRAVQSRPWPTCASTPSPGRPCGRAAWTRALFHPGRREARRLARAAPPARPGRRALVGYVGRLAPEKELHRLAGARRRLTGSALVLVGEGPPP